jgi:hypothetical protein
METVRPLQMQRVANSVPWMLVSLVLCYGSMSALGRNNTGAAFGFVGAALMIWVAWRSARLRLLLGDEVVIVGWFGRTTIQWSEIQKFDYNRKGFFIKQVGGLETMVPAFTMGASLLKSVQRSQEAEMQQLVAKAENIRRSRIGSSAKPKPKPAPTTGKRKGGRR